MICKPYSLFYSTLLFFFILNTIVSAQTCSCGCSSPGVGQNSTMNSCSPAGNSFGDSTTKVSSCCSADTQIKSQLKTQYSAEGLWAFGYVTYKLGAVTSLNKGIEAVKYDSKNGANLKDFISAAKQLGWKAWIFRVREINAARVSKPLILISNDHYGVLTAYDSDQKMVHIAAPDNPDYSLPVEKLFEQWNYVLLFEKLDVSLNN